MKEGNDLKEGKQDEMKMSDQLSYDPSSLSSTFIFMPRVKQARQQTESN